MDHFHSTGHAESASTNDHLAVQTKEGATKEGNNTVPTGGMELSVFRAAEQGDLDALRERAEHLELKLTATNNTVLHIYIACSSSPKSEQKDVESTRIVEDILEMCPALLLLNNKSGETALHIAARHGRAGIVRVLIDQAAKVRHHGDLEQGQVLTEEEACLQKQMLIRKTNNNNKNTALHEAVRFNQRSVVEKLTKEDPEYSYAANDLGETPLYLAVERGYLRLVSIMLSNCNDPTYNGPNGRTALHAAVIRKDEALHFAASEGNLDVMKELISHCPDCCELVDNKFQNALHYATRNGGYQIVGYVLTDAWLSNILLNAMDIDGNTPLAHSPYSMLFTKCIFDAKVDIMAFNKENLNVLDIILANEDKISLLQKDLKKRMQRRGIQPSLRIKNPKGNSDNKVEENQISKDIGKGLQKAKETHLVVATLIATVTFAAGFTMPGGYQSEKGPDQGSVFLSRNAAFKAFVITDAIAMAMSSCSVLVLLIPQFTQRGISRTRYLGRFTWQCL